MTNTVVECGAESEKIRQSQEYGKNGVQREQSAHSGGEGFGGHQRTFLHGICLSEKTKIYIIYNSINGSVLQEE